MKETPSSPLLPRFSQRLRSIGNVFVALMLWGMFLATGCSSIISPPQPLLSDSLTAELLIELHLANARTIALGEIAPAAPDTILARYGLDSTRFQTLMGYYADHPEAYLTLYEKVLNRLNAERTTQTGMIRENYEAEELQ